MTILLNIGNGEDPNRVGDVVFLHGLNGDPKGTWSHGPEEGFCPSWLAMDCPKLGVWSIGYNVAASSWKGTAMPLFDRATNILAELQAEGLGTKPLCFITHSMGGLLVKQILRNANSLTPQFHLFSTAVRGGVFLATPHTGSDLARLANYLKFFLRTTIAVRELEHAAPALRELNLWYRQHADRLDIKTQVCFETQKTKGVQVVDEASADPGLKDVTPIGVDANHLTIAKPSSRKSVIYRLSKQFVMEVLLTAQTSSEPQTKAVRLEEAAEVHYVRKAVPIIANNHPRPFLVPPLPPQGVFGRNKDLANIYAQLALSDRSITEVPPWHCEAWGESGRRPSLLQWGE